MTKIDIGIRLPPKSSRIWDSLYVVSNNGRRVFDLVETRAELGYEPQDDAEAYY